MRKVLSALLAALIATSLICSAFAGMGSFADSVTPEQALAAAAPELYGMYTAATANYLRDCADKASVSGAGESEAAALTEALGKLVPLENYTRRELMGFGGLTDTDIASMSRISGSASVSDGFVTLRGEGALRYSNAAPDGVFGASPFGMATEDCDGFALKITSDADALLDLEIGRRGSADDCVAVIGDIFVSQGERYYLFPFSRFGTLPLDGTLNYISLSFTGAGEVTFGDLHAAANTAEVASAKREYSETPVTAQEFDSEKYHKILQKGTDLALTMVNGKNGASVEFRKKDDSDKGQLWQLCPDPEIPSRYRMVSKLNGYAIQPSYTGELALITAVPSPADTLQEWSLTYSKAKGFSFYITNVGRLSYSANRVRITGLNITVKYFDVLAVEGEHWNLVWSDEFNGDELDRTNWTVMNSKNRPDTEPMYNRDSPKNLFIEDGNLVIKSIVEEYNGYHATSAYLSTDGKLDFGYGRFEMYARMPEGNKIWPAFWMMGNDDVWPRCGEIDVLEMVGSGPDNDWLFDKRVIGTLHYNNAMNMHIEEGGLSRGCPYDSEKLSSRYHMYAVEWDADEIRWYYDDLLYLTVPIDTQEKQVAFRENPMFLILDTSIEGPGKNQLPDGLPDTSEFYIDYIRYYRETDSAAPADDIPYKYDITGTDMSTMIWSPANAGCYSSATDTLVYTNAAANEILYDIKNLRQRASLKSGSYGWSMSSVISGDGSTIIDGREIGLVRTDVATRAMLGASDVYLHFPRMALSYDGSVCYVGGTPSREVPLEFRDHGDYLHVFETENMTEIHREYTGSWVDSVATAKNGNYAFGCYDGTVRVRSASHEDLGSFSGIDRMIGLKFSSDDKLLYASDANGRIYVFDTESRSVSELTAPICDEIYKLAVSPDGSKLAAACGDSCVRVYDTSNGRLIYSAALGDFVVSSADFSLDGKLLIANGTSGKVGIYRADDGLPLVRLSDTKMPNCWYITAALASDSSALMAIRNSSGNFNSYVTGWKLPANLTPDEADFSALDEIDFRDELKYTAESYSAYAAARKRAFAVRANRYSTQAEIDAAARALSEAEAALVHGETVRKGDFDGDGDITVTDALAALRIAAKLAPETAKDIAIGDIDGDGSISVTDALAILRVAAKLADTL